MTPPYKTCRSGKNTRGEQQISLYTAFPRSMVINTRKLWGVTKKVQLITIRTLITMTFQMVLISWVYIWPQNRPKRSLSNLSWNFWVFPVTSSGRNGKQKGGECFCFGNFLALFVLPSLLCAHSHQERENLDKPSLVLIVLTKETQKEKSSFHFIWLGCSLWLYTQDLGTFKNAFYRSNIV